MHANCSVKPPRRVKSIPLFGCCGLLVAMLLLGTAGLGAAEDRETVTREDRKIAEAAGPWVYNDLDKGIALARESGKPLLVVFRCPP